MRKDFLYKYSVIITAYKDYGSERPPLEWVYGDTIEQAYQNTVDYIQEYGFDTHRVEINIVGDEDDIHAELRAVRIDGRNKRISTDREDMF